MNCSKWKSFSIGCYNTRQNVSCHVLYEIKEIEEWFCIAAIGHTLQFFLLNSPTNNQDLDKNLFKELPCQFVGIQHQNGTVVDMSWCDRPISFSEIHDKNQCIEPSLMKSYYWKGLSCSTDGLLLYWSLRLDISKTKQSILQAKTSCISLATSSVTTSMTPTYASCVNWAFSQNANEAVVDLFAASLTLGYLLVCWKNDHNSPNLQYRHISIYPSTDISLGFKFVWHGEYLLCASRFSSTVMCYTCDDWTKDSILLTSTWQSNAKVCALAISDCKTVAAWSDISGIFVFIDSFHDLKNVTTLKWFGRRFQCITFLSSSQLIAVGFDGVPVLFKKQGFPLEWNYHTMLSVPFLIPKPLKESTIPYARHASRSVSLCQKTNRACILSAANDYGIISLWKLDY